MKIAVVGTGISGLAVAHALHRNHALTVFESADWIGGHTHTVDVEIEGAHHAVDTGFIVYNERTYPGFVGLLSELGVSTQPTDMSFSVRCDRSGLEYSSSGLQGLFAQRRNALRPSFLRMVSEIPRFNRAARALLASPDEKTTLGDWLDGLGLSRQLRDHYVLPMGAAIWSTPAGKFLQFPASTFARFFENHGLLETRERLPWRVVRGGSRTYVEALTAPFRDRIRPGSRVRAVWREDDGVHVAAPGGVERFDRVVLACHADQALNLLIDADGAERQTLDAFAYQPNRVVLHTDRSVLPRSRRAWASWNYRTPRQPESPVAVTYHMNRLQGFRASEELLVTLNDDGAIDPARVLESWTYHHPVFTPEAIAAQKHHDRIDGRDRVHFCGAYWRNGFHEDGLQSALAVVRHLGGER